MMKKIFSLILAFLFLSANNCLAVSELYYLKNIKTSALTSTVENAFASQSYSMIQRNPYYGISSKNNSDYATVILQQSGDNMFYYYNSNGNNKINKQILKVVKNSNIVCEQSFNTNLLDIYENLSNKLLNNQNLNNYTFEDNTTTSTARSSATSSSQYSNSSYSGYVAKIDKGTRFGVYLQNAINTAQANVGDQVVAVLTSNWTYNGHLIAGQGSLVYGQLKKARSAQYASRNGRVVIEFNRIVTTEGKTYYISADTIDFTVSNEGKIGETTKNTAVGAVVGALTGLLFGALSGSESIASAAIVGAGVGAGGALIGNVAQKGVDAEIPAFTEFDLVLTKPLSVSLTN